MVEWKFHVGMFHVFCGLLFSFVLGRFWAREHNLD